ncbi:MAG: hypothetical protein ABIC91_00195 [Nanoarchaeota archaeon]
MLEHEVRNILLFRACFCKRMRGEGSRMKSEALNSAPKSNTLFERRRIILNASNERRE